MLSIMIQSTTSLNNRYSEIHDEIETFQAVLSEFVGTRFSEKQSYNTK